MRNEDFGVSPRAEMEEGIFFVLGGVVEEEEGEAGVLTEDSDFNKLRI